MSDPALLAEAAKPAVFWSDSPDAPEPCSPLTGRVDTELCIIGAGFTGLWAAIQALEDNPGRRVLLLEAEVGGFGGSSRNGGFCDASLTHGFLNGLNHWPDDIATLQRLAGENFEAILHTIERYGIDADAHRTDEVEMAVADWQVAELAEAAEIYAEHGFAHTLLDQAAARAIANSPTYLGGIARHNSTALVDPARLVWGLERVAGDLGATRHDHSRVTGVTDERGTLCVSTSQGSVRADRVIVATNAWAQPVRQMRRYVVPVYDHVLMTEPLSTGQQASIGWQDREGIGDAGDQFHYYRRTRDNRILWGGYDANYYYGNGMGPAYEDRISSHQLLARHFFETFPQLEGLNFTHRWAGPIGTTSKFAAAFGCRHKGRLAWAAGYTGLGVGASRFGARVALDLVDGLDTERTDLEMVRKKPVPFPPEPLRSLAIQGTRRAIQRSDANSGRRGPWLRLLDRFGVGFDS